MDESSTEWPSGENGTNWSRSTWGNSSLDWAPDGAGPPRELFGQYPQELLDFAVAACIAFIMIGVPGNFITILALLRYSKARNATAMFIINLSVSDLMFCCFNLPLATSLFYKRAWLLGDTLCILFPFMRYGLLAVSIFTVLAITLNRYIMIGHPRLYPKLYKRRHLILMIALTWIGCFGALIPTLLGLWGRFGLDTDIGSCSILQDRSHRSPKEFLFVVAFVLPCLAIVVCYARIFFIVRKAAARSGAAGQRTRRSPGLSGQASSAETCLVPPGVTRGSMRVGMAGGKKKQATLEPSFQLTCCESQQGSGSTEVSEDPPMSSDQVKSNTILRWKESRKSSIRIQVERRSSDQQKDEADPLRPTANSLCPPDSAKDRRISVTFELAGDEDGHDQGRGADNSASQYLQVPIPGQQAPQPSGGTKINTSSSETELTPGSPVHSEASSVGSINADHSSGGGRSALSNALSQVSEAFHRRSTVRRSTVKNRHPGRMTAKDRKLLQMILVIFVAFIVCYMPITIVKSLSKEMDLRALNIAGYVLIYLTTCINPIIYVVMSSEYRQAYKNLLTCKTSGERGPVPSRSFSQKA